MLVWGITTSVGIQMNFQMNRGATTEREEKENPDGQLVVSLTVPTFAKSITLDLKLYIWSSSMFLSFNFYLKI